MNQMDILEYLKDNGPKTARQIAAENDLDIDLHAIHHKLNQLKKFGVVEKIERDKSDAIWRAI